MSFSSGIPSAFNFDEKRDYEIRRSRKSRSNSSASTISTASTASNASTHSRTSSYSSPFELSSEKSSSRRVHFLSQPLPMLSLSDNVAESRKRSRSEGDYAWWALQRSQTRRDSWGSEQQKEYFSKETNLGEGKQDVRRL